MTFTGSRRGSDSRKALLLVGALALNLSGAASQTRDDRWAVLITGISGDPQLREQFLGWTRDLYGTLSGQLKFPKERIFVLFEDPSLDPGMIRYASTRDNLIQVCRKIAESAEPDDLVFFFIAGHGNYDGRIYKLNLPGPDPTAEDLAAMMEPIPAKRSVVVNMTTCSGASVPLLSKKGRIVISATKSGNEKNQTHMGRFFVEALKENRADMDKNGRVSLLEAYSYASQKVEEYYTQAGNLQTEHSVLEDNGDGTANAKPGPENGEGFLSRTTYLDVGPPLLTRGEATPEQRALLLEAQSVEKEIEALKYAKADIPADEYEKKLEDLLVKLATIQSRLRKDK
jgi:hypothetical protein